MTQREYPPASVHADSPMTPEYRHNLLKCLANHARGELEAADTYASWVPRAPGPAEKKYVAEIANEETNHWCRVIKLMEELGVNADRVADYHSSQWFIRIAHLAIPRITWLDVLAAAFLIDRAAYFVIEEFTQSSYAPWARLSQEILNEEEGHADFGSEFLSGQIQKRGVAPVQRSLHRWWRVALNMFGPQNTERTDLYIRYGLKTRHNEERRQAFRRDCEPRIRALGLEVPKLYRENYPFF